MFMRRTIEDVIKYIESNFLCEVVNEDCEENSYLLNKMIEVTKDNIDNYIKSNDINVQSLNIKMYKLFSTGNKDEFFEQFLEDNDFEKEFIFIIFEKSTEYIYCSSNKLYSFLEIYKGVSEEDATSNNIRYKHFLFLKNEYPEYKEL